MYDGKINICGCAQLIVSEEGSGCFDVYRDYNVFR